jgi:hypothetical protein
VPQALGFELRHVGGEQLPSLLLLLAARDAPGITQRSQQRPVARRTHPHAEREQHRAAERAGQQEGSQRKARRPPQEGRLRRARRLPRRGAVRQDHHELAALQAGPDLEGGAHRRRVEVDDPNPSPRRQRLEEGVDPLGVALEHHHVHHQLVPLGQEPQHVEAPQMGAQQKRAVSGLGELEDPVAPVVLDLHRVERAAPYQHPVVESDGELVDVTQHQRGAGPPAQGGATLG